MAEYAASRRCVRPAACGFFPKRACGIPQQKSCFDQHSAFPLEILEEKLQTDSAAQGQHLTEENDWKHRQYPQKEKVSGSKTK